MCLLARAFRALLDSFVRTKNQDEGGSPSAPTASQFSPVIPAFSQGYSSLPSPFLHSSLTPPLYNRKNGNNSYTKKNLKSTFNNENKNEQSVNKFVENHRQPVNKPIIDPEGFQLVQNKNKKRKNIIGLRKASGITNLKSAPRKLDIYLGNCDLTVTPEDVKEYILKEVNIHIDECVQLNCKDPKCKSFRISVDIKEKNKILNANVWPEEIICRKFFHLRRINKNY